MPRWSWKWEKCCALQSISWFGAHYKSVLSNCITDPLFTCFETLLFITGTYLLNDLKNEFPDIHINEVLITLDWLKCYCIEWVISGLLKVGCMEYLQNTVRDYTKKIATFGTQKIAFDGFESDDIDPYAVDCVHYLTGKFVQLCTCSLVHMSPIVLFSNWICDGNTSPGREDVPCI